MSETTLTKATLYAALLVIGAASGAMAHSNEARQFEQADQIEEGRRDGSITWREGQVLRKDQREIAHVKEVMEADGKLTRDEKHVLYKLQDAAQDHIDDEANDTWHRAWWLPRIAR